MAGPEQQEQSVAGATTLKFNYQLQARSRVEEKRHRAADAYISEATVVVLAIRAITVLCKGTLKGVQLVHSGRQAVVKPCHPQQGEGKDVHCYIKPE